MYKTFYVFLPAYLTGLISKHVPSRSSSSRDADLFYIPRTFPKYGDSRFDVCVPFLWNNLPKPIKNADSVLNL